MHCILHVGIHKTGSSAIQQRLADYDDGRIFYANMGDPNHSYLLYTAFSPRYMEYWFWKARGLDRSAIIDKRKQALALFERELSKEERDCVIFSGEDISLIEEEGLKALIEMINAYCEQKTVIAYVRDPLEFAASNFQQQVLGGLANSSPSITPSFRFRFERLSNIVNKQNIILRDFSREGLKDGDVVYDFAELAGLDRTRFKPLVVGESMSSDALKWIFLFNNTCPVHSGDDFLFKARNRFNRAVVALYQDSERIPKEVFLNCADYSEVDWLAENFGIQYKRPNRSQADYDLPSWLNHFTEDSIDKMVRMLADRNVSSDFGRIPTKLINRFFYLFLRDQADGGGT